MAKNSNNQQSGPGDYHVVLARAIDSVPIILFTLVVVSAHILFPEYPNQAVSSYRVPAAGIDDGQCLGLAIAWRNEGIGGSVTLVFYIAHLWRIGKFAGNCSP